VSVTVSSNVRPDPADFDVYLGSRPLDGPVASTAAAPDIPYVRPRHLKRLLDDPGNPGSHPVQSGDYVLDPVKLPDIPQKSEMVGHVVEPIDATDSAPLVLFLHGRSLDCYRPRHGESSPFPQSSDPDAWTCDEGTIPVPNYLGYRYVQRLLANQGYVTVSISADAINGLDWHTDDGGAAARAALIRHHLEQWVDFVAADTHHADLDNVILVGHSRGGEGANRAALHLPRDAGYAVTGQLLIGPTDFGYQAAPYTPTITLLPYCDGDVSDLQGQNFTDDARDLAAGEPIAFHSSALVMGANHDFFNTEWTPGISAARSSDDWFGPATKTCGTDTAMRLTAAEQRAVGKAYIAGAVHLFADGDQGALPMFDGSAVTVASAGNADVRSHAIGGGLDIRRPELDSSVGTVDGASMRLCVGVSDTSRPRACKPGVSSWRAPHWPSQRFARGVPLRAEFELHWTARGQSAGIDLADPWDISGASALNVRTIVDPTSAGRSWTWCCSTGAAAPPS
jgi:pimeloyl-ACP methyl ester carboxylesterase